MPHVIVKMYTGRTEDQKRRLAEAIKQAVMDIAGTESKAVSVGIEEFSKEEWPEKVYRPDIINKSKTLVIKPGYNPFENK
jgi:4-oxalocrotonate tautomerase